MLWNYWTASCSHCGLLPREALSTTATTVYPLEPNSLRKGKITMTNTIENTLNPEGPAPPVPTIDPSLLKLDGRTYRDLSRPAAAQRAAYYRAKAAQFLASPPAEQAAMAGIGNHFANFTNYGTSPDWKPDYGTQEAGAEGWMLHSHGATSSR